MGQAVLSNYVEHMREVAIATCPGCSPSAIASSPKSAPIRVEVAITCPGSSCSKVSSQRKRAEDLMHQVEEVRQENQRLQLKTQEIRYSPVKDLAPPNNSPQVGAQQQELVRLKRRLWDLQRENNELKESVSKQSNAQGTGTFRAAQGGPLAIQNGSHGAFSSSEELNKLERQVSELQRVHDMAVRQTSQLRSQQASDNNVRRKVEALRNENEALRRKVRMLAVA